MGPPRSATGSGARQPRPPANPPAGNPARSAAPSPSSLDFDELSRVASPLGHDRHPWDSWDHHRLRPSPPETPDDRKPLPFELADGMHDAMGRELGPIGIGRYPPPPPPPFRHRSCPRSTAGRLSGTTPTRSTASPASPRRRRRHRGPRRLLGRRREALDVLPALVRRVALPQGRPRRPPRHDQRRYRLAPGHPRLPRSPHRRQGRPPAHARHVRRQLRLRLARKGRQPRQRRRPPHRLPRLHAPLALPRGPGVGYKYLGSYDWYRHSPSRSCSASGSMARGAAPINPPPTR